MNDKNKESEDKSKNFRGVTIDIAVDDRVNDFLTKQDTQILNNNPRETELNKK